MRSRYEEVRKMIVKVVREKGKIDVAELAAILNYSPHYLRYNLLPYVARTVECIELQKNVVEWVCENERA